MSLLLRHYVILSMIFDFSVARSFPKKLKLMPPQGQRIRYRMQLEDEESMEELLEGLKSKFNELKVPYV